MKSSTVLPLLPDRLQAPDISRLVAFLVQYAVFDSLLNISGSTTNVDSSITRQLLWGGLGLSAIVYMVLCRVRQSDKTFSFGGWPVVSLLAYAFVSTAWSVTPSATFKRSVVLLFLIAVCAISVGAWNQDWRRDTFSRLLAPPVAWLTTLALMLTVVAPGRVFTAIGWRGVSGTKNEAGQMMVMCIVLLLYGVCYDWLKPRMRFGLLLLAAVFMLLTKSTTALLGLGVGIVFTEILTLPATLRRLGSWRVVVLGIPLAIAVVLFFAYQLNLLPTAHQLYEKVLAAMGKSDTFTGRTAIWNLVLAEDRFHNPWLGGGYGGFWVGRESISGYVILGDNLYPGQAHNGYIDIYNDMGYLGLGLLAAVVLASLYRAFRLLQLQHPEAKIHLCITLLLLFLNLGESTFFRSTQFMNIFFIASLVRTSSILRQARAEAEQTGEREFEAQLLKR